MSGFLTILLGLFAVVFGVLAVMVLRRPLLGRVALREAVRRPGQTVVVVAGLMVAGASIYTVQVFADSFTQTLTNQALKVWGREDLEISAGGAYFDPALASQLAADPKLSSATFQNAIVFTGSVTDVDRALGKPGVQVIGLDVGSQHRFGSFVLAGGRRTEGSELANGEVFITQPLAEALAAQVGDWLRVSGTADATVAGIVKRDDAGAYGNYRSLFGSLETVQKLAGTKRVNVIRVSAPGDADAEINNGHRLIPTLQADVGSAGLRVWETKRGALEILKTGNASLRAFFTGLSLIVVLAASAMVVNLAVMLAEERRPRLAVMRALGLTRSGLVQLSVLEGAFYSLAAAIAGTVPGLAVGMLIASYLNPALGSSGDNLAAAPTFRLESLLGSIAATSMLTLVTLFATSLRTSRLAISSAIRDLPEPAKPDAGSRLRLALLVVGILAGLSLLVVGSLLVKILAGGVVIVCAGGLIRGRLPERARFSMVGAALAAWGIIYYDSNGRSWDSSTQLPGTVLAVLVAVSGLSVLAAANLTLLEAAARFPGRLTAGLRMTLRPALAYSSRRPLRSGLVIAAFGLVAAMLTLFSANINAGRPDYAVDSGGWDVRVSEVGSADLSLPPEVQANVAREEALPSRTFLGAVRKTNNGLGDQPEWHQDLVTVFGLSDEQLAAGIMPLVQWEPRYPNAAAAWQAMAEDPTLVAASTNPGAQLELQTPRGTVRLTVVAQQGSFSVGAQIVPGLLASRRTLDYLSGSPPGELLLLKAAPGVSARALADQVQRATLAQGADATTTREILDDSFAVGRGFFDLLLTVMRVGLLVGILSLGTIALRAVVERRRAIGVLRAVGFQPGQLLLGTMLETALVASAGLAVGLAVAYSVGEAGLVFGGASAKAFEPDPGALWAAIAVVYAAVLLVTLLPALRAARLRPAEALRGAG